MSSIGEILSIECAAVPRYKLLLIEHPPSLIDLSVQIVSQDTRYSGDKPTRIQEYELRQTRCQGLYRRCRHGCRRADRALLLVDLITSKAIHRVDKGIVIFVVFIDTQGSIIVPSKGFFRIGTSWHTIVIDVIVALTASASPRRTKVLDDISKVAKLANVGQEVQSITNIFDVVQALLPQQSDEIVPLDDLKLVSYFAHNIADFQSHARDSGSDMTTEYGIVPAGVIATGGYVDKLLTKTIKTGILGAADADNSAIATKYQLGAAEWAQELS
mmetsp:Transcript_14610/g.42035  ORF Transcript_14610/g.42035 Transcript_14610/m.42035 type:complete len:272 (-) Transcript_14610:2826-3641(-)